jgi:hypothetical protein
MSMGGGVSCACAGASEVESTEIWLEQSNVLLRWKCCMCWIVGGAAGVPPLRRPAVVDTGQLGAALQLRAFYYAGNGSMLTAANAIAILQALTVPSPKLTSQC